MHTEHFYCPKCGTKKSVESVGHATYVPCPKCHKPMKRDDMEEYRPAFEAVLRREAAMKAYKKPGRRE